MPEVCGSNQVNGKILNGQLNIERTKINKNGPEMVPFSNNIGMRRVTTAISIAN